MGRELVDTRTQNFWKELYTKEAYIRLAWHHKYGKEKKFVKERCSLTSEQKRMARERKLTSMVPQLPKRVLPVITYPKKQPIKIPTLRKCMISDLGDPDTLLAEMRPVTPDVKQTLYDGFTKEGKGRSQYLQTRNLKIPEEKYEFPLTTSWDYGWRLSDAIKEFRSPEYGRSGIIRDTFYRRNGISFHPIAI